ELVGRDVAVIFTTAHDEYAIKAFEVHAVDYLLKPVRRERLSAALSKVTAQLTGIRPAEAARSTEMPRKIVGRQGADQYLLDPAEVVAFQADGELVYILTNNARYYADQPLRVLQQKLGPRFRRVHRKTIINTDHIRRISPLSSKRWLLRMSSGLEVIVSKRLAGAIREATDW
ncbi:MAG TPA: DNA-binding response regulator, partial [Solibacterales bacterium]|nr:DNA-binding response regulator [Bryobacterales bacterium]